jgi:phosphosulfolactate synthase (CoM biosynthesis protein A)
MAGAFNFLRQNTRSSKPRTRGVTEIRGPYYTVFGKRYLTDLLETAGEFVDHLKFAGGSFTLLPEAVLTELIDLCHQHHVAVSTGGFVERVLTQGPEAVERYLVACRDVGFDIVEVSSGFVSVPAEDLLRLAERVRGLGMKVKPEVGIQFGAGGGTDVTQLEREGTRDVNEAIALARRYREAGAELIMIESEGITENVGSWRTDAIASLVNELGLDALMFEAAAPDVFTWYVKTYGAEVNLFIDHSQLLQLEALRQGIWGTADVWGRIARYDSREGSAGTSASQESGSRPERA